MRVSQNPISEVFCNGVCQVKNASDFINAEINISKDN